MTESFMRIVMATEDVRAVRRSQRANPNFITETQRGRAATKAVFHHGDAEFAESGVSFD
jgi:hypothetical protein